MTGQAPCAQSESLRDGFDIAIVGGGFAGACLAAVLARAGIRIAVVDLHPIFPSQFRAEKLGVDQIALLDSLDLWERLRERATPVPKMRNTWRGSLVDVRCSGEFALPYADIVNGIREQVASDCVWFYGRVVDAELSGDLRLLTLDDGRILEARLVVMATGLSDSLRQKLGIKKTIIQAQQCLAVGFTLEPPGPASTLHGVTCYGEKHGGGLDYVCLFPLGKSVRVNAFMFLNQGKQAAIAFKHDPVAALVDHVPDLKFRLEGHQLLGTPSFHMVDLYRCEGFEQDGLVLVGDAFRTSCPAAGTGLTCALNDIAVLAPQVPRWLRTPGMCAEKVRGFYDHPAKRSFDAFAHRIAADRRDAIIQTGIAPRLRRRIHFLARKLRYRLSGEITSRSKFRLSPNRGYENTGRRRH